MTIAAMSYKKRGRSTTKADPRTKEMLRLKLEGMSSEKIGRLQTPPISHQRVDQLLKPFPVTKRYVRDRAESSPDDTQGGIKSFLDKIVLKVWKHR